MRVPSSHVRSNISENMMTSMIDVVFLLLIFFVCAATGQIREALLPTTLNPGAETAPTEVETPKPADLIWIYLTLGESGQTVMKLNGTEYETFAALKATLTQLAEIAPETPVVLDIAGDVSAGEMIKVYDTCVTANFHSINFKARPLEKQRSRIRTPDDSIR